jgi:hypothetical protein
MNYLQALLLTNTIYPNKEGGDLDRSIQKFLLSSSVKGGSKLGKRW